MILLTARTENLEYEDELVIEYTEFLLMKRRTHIFDLRANVSTVKLHQLFTRFR